MKKNYPAACVSFYCSSSFIALLLMVCLPMAVSAQKKIIKGYLKDSALHTPLVNATITNENTRKIVNTDNTGFFSISTTRGNMLFFEATGYHFDTLHFDSPLPDTITIFLSELPHNLEAVTVYTKGAGTQYQVDSARRRKEFEGDVGKKMKTFSPANSGAGVGINLDAFFKKKERSKDIAYEDFAEFENDAYVSSRFSHDFVGTYTGLKGDTLQNFMNLYRPEYKWLRNHPSDDELVFYINEKLKLFYKRKKNR